MSTSPHNVSTRALHGAGVRAALACVLGVLAVVGCEPGSVPKPNVVLIVIDTLRADHLGAYGYDKPTSPNIDAIARQGTVFQSAHSTTSWTLPSVVSIFTGLYPAAHGVERNVSLLGDEPAVLAEAFGAAGYESMAISANVAFVTPHSGVARGFAQFEVLPSPPPTDPPSPDQMAGDSHFQSLVRVPTADLLTDRALTWLDERSKSGSRKPFFLYLHYFDPHAGYFPPADYARRFGVSPEEPLAGRAQWALWRKHQVPGAAGPEALAVLRALYDAEIAFTDAEIGRFLEGLRKVQQEPEPIVIVTADHGEELGDHGGLQHGQTLWEEVLHVPLVISGPGVPKEARVDAPVSLVSLWPTIAALTRIDLPPKVQGISLIPLMQGKASTPEKIFADLEPVFPGYRHVHRKALSQASWKLLMSPTKTVELYDLFDDPAETRNLAATEPSRTAFLKTLLRNRLDLTRTKKVVSPKRQLDDDQRERLRALGYLQ